MAAAHHHQMALYKILVVLIQIWNIDVLLDLLKLLELSLLELK